MPKPLQLLSCIRAHSNHCCVHMFIHSSCIYYHAESNIYTVSRIEDNFSCFFCTHPQIPVDNLFLNFLHTQSAYVLHMYTSRFMILRCSLFSQFVVNLGVLEHLERFTQFGNEILDRDVFWLLSNVLAGTQEHIQVIDTL